MAALSRQEVEEIARLARLELEAGEVERLRSELSAILGHMERIRALDTEGIEPMTHAVPLDLRLREDEPGESLPVESAVGAAPDSADGCFRVPHILPAAEED